MDEENMLEQGELLCSSRIFCTFDGVNNGMYATPDFLASSSTDSDCCCKGSFKAFRLKGKIPQILKPPMMFFMDIAFIHAFEKIFENTYLSITTPGFIDI